MAALLGICGFAVTQPLLDVFGGAPEQFAFREATSTDIVLFAVAIAVVPAVLLWLPGAVAGRFSDRVGSVLHLAAIALSLFIGMLQVARHLLGMAGPSKAIVAALGAAAGTWLYRRFAAARSWSQVMALSSVVFVGLFLFSTPAGELAFSEPPDVVALEADPSRKDGEPLPDIIMIMLDELPTALLLDEEGGIDRSRFPSLAALADDATWYRSFTTVSAETVQAVPAILSGQLPSESSEAVWTRRPDNLFRLLGGSYHMTASESLTRLCPAEWCGTADVPPGDGPAAPTASQPSPPAAIDAPPAGSEEVGWRGLVTDGFDVWTAQIALDRDLPVLTGFEETAVAVPATSDGSTPTEDSSLPSLPSGSARLFAFRPDDRSTELPRVEWFKDAITAREVPSLAYLHLLLPHSPYIFTRSGATYDGPAVGRGTAATWDAQIVAHQMALQMEFTDSLIGDVMDDARDEGVYDDAIIIVLADHAAGLDGEKASRYYDGTNASELMVTPLFVKAPGQTEGVVSDAPIEAVDVLPTLADMLDIDVPWSMDGSSALGRDPQYVDPECDDVRRFMRFDIFLVGGSPGDADLFELCANELVPPGLEPILGERRADDEWETAPLARSTPFEELLGLPWRDLGAEPGAVTVTLDRAMQTTGGSSPPLGVVRGTVDAPIADEWVAVSVDGRIAGISPIYDTRSFLTDATLASELDTERQFTVLLPTALLDEDGYDVRVASLRTTAEGPIATELPVGP